MWFTGVGFSLGSGWDALGWDPRFSMGWGEVLKGGFFFGGERGCSE